MGTPPPPRTRTPAPPCGTPDVWGEEISKEFRRLLIATDQTGEAPSPQVFPETKGRRVIPDRRAHPREEGGEVAVENRRPTKGRSKWVQDAASAYAAGEWRDLGRAGPPLADRRRSGWGTRAGGLQGGTGTGGVRKGPSQRRCPSRPPAGGPAGSPGPERLETRRLGMPGPPGRRARHVQGPSRVSQRRTSATRETLLRRTAPKALSPRAGDDRHARVVAPGERPREGPYPRGRLGSGDARVSRTSGVGVTRRPLRRSLRR